ncbi:hypothetical protein PQU92_14860 [Asticcacaulis sp. BYS171W]|uniref:Carboxypeptidase regulatory-like domain-containing protein n=1 Tax=Asticcacaulis aquaticus TaxID=2984212 RepID=A0ABT5HXA2_9CAUL|nr:hypothetical protein [Asticcacaulis aquaticus]MDC7684563.1 hypothetical protein [Asticcacaulis aquaticus]
MTPSLITASVLGLIVLIGMGRLLWWWHTAPRDRRSSVRLGVLLIGQPLCAVLLYLTLFPPPLASAPGTLIVATYGARQVSARAGDRLIALPEATVSGAERVPDLAAALRQYPATRLLIVGDGLTARDRDAASGLKIDFEPAPLPRGLIRLDLPERVSPGGRFHIGGQVHDLKGGTVDLIDPAGKLVETQPVPADGAFVLSGTARAAGPATFTLRLRDAGKSVIQTVEAPLWIADGPPPRVRVMAGAPGPEIKYLRRWATDAGVTLHTQTMLGGGMAAGDPPLPVTAAALREVDLLVLDERSWETIGASGRSAVLEAVHGGMGLLLRLTAPPSPDTRTQWAALGLRLSGSGEAKPVILPPTGTETVKPVPLTRLDYRIEGADAVPIVPSAPAVGLWRAEGRGRVGVWTVTDSFGLTLSGQDGHDILWAGVFTTLTRPPAGAPPVRHAMARVNERLTLCGLNGTLEWLDAEGGSVTPLIDPATGAERCAAVWPRQAGWHLLRQTTDAGTQLQPVFVHATDALPGVVAGERQTATRRLMTDAPQTASLMSGEKRRGAAWPWFLGWLTVAAGLWWFERARPAIRTPS